MTDVIQSGGAGGGRTTIDGDALARQIQDAVDQALSQAGTSAQQAATAREGLRGTIEEIRAEIEAARAQGVERIVVQPQFGDNMIPPQAVDISIAFFVMFAFVIVGLPLARAFARRMDRRGAAAPASELAPRLDRIEQAIEAVAIEVERVSEGQRYTTKAISELRGLPSANAPGGWPAGAREAERVPLGEARRP
jgi:hypothetical protein